MFSDRGNIYQVLLNINITMRNFIDIIENSFKHQFIGDAILESFELEATPLSDEQITSAKLPENVKEKLFKNRKLTEGTLVAVRLNLNGKVGSYFLQTVHSRTATGAVLGYDGAVTVRDARFQVSQRARELIATRQENKYPMAAVVGGIAQVPALLTGVELRFNPMQGHLFEDMEGYAVKSAEEVTVFNTRCFARGKIEYWDEGEAPSPLGNVPTSVRFKKG